MQRACATLLTIAAANLAVAAEKVTYTDDVLPVFRDHCLKCHNTDKQRGDLDLSTFAGALKGGSSGSSPNAGDPDGSLLVQVLTHASEPLMPPNSPKIPEKQLALVKAWIEGGLLETSGSRAIAATKPKVDLTLKAAPGKPEGPPPMPGELPMEPSLVAARQTVVTALASSPWAPVLAVGTHQQVSLYHSETGDFLGVLPFPQGFPHEVKFSRNGRLLLAAGGRGGKSGDVVLWNLADGELLGGVSGEYDSVLTADLSPDQSRIALGGTDRLLKIYEVATGALLHKVKKHTEWVTAVEFSPDGKYLVSGDRAGNVLLWEAGGASELFALNGHKGPITSVSWRGDSAMILSASEDGTVKVWRPSDGELVKSWTAHNAVLDARFGMDGSIVSSGRDGKATVWDVTGKALKALALKAELPNRVVLSHDGSRAWVSDFSGWVAGFTTADGKPAPRVPSVPPRLEQRIVEANAALKELDQKLRETEAQETALRIALDAARGERAEMEARLEELRGDIARTGERIENTEKSVASEQPESEAKELPELRAKLADFKSESANLKAVKLPEAEKQIADLEKKHAAALMPVEPLRSELAPARSQLQRWQAAQDSEKRRMAAR